MATYSSYIQGPVWCTDIQGCHHHPCSKYSRIIPATAMCYNQIESWYKPNPSRRHCKCSRSNETVKVGHHSYLIFKNVLITSYKKNSETVKLRNFSFFLSSTFIYQPILIKISMIANIKKMQIFQEMKYDPKGH